MGRETRPNINLIRGELKAYVVATTERKSASSILAGVLHTEPWRQGEAEYRFILDHDLNGT